MIVLYTRPKLVRGEVRNIYESGELDEGATTEDSSVVRQEGKRQVRRSIPFYNLTP